MRNLMPRSSGTFWLAVDHPALYLHSAARGVENTHELSQ
jgi:hypothetical protein